MCRSSAVPSENGFACVAGKQGVWKRLVAEHFSSMAPKATMLLLLLSLVLTAHAQYSSSGAYNAVPTQVHMPL